MRNEKYSNKDFTNQDFTDVDPSEFNNTTIDSSCFYRECRESEAPPFDIFPAGMTGVNFVDCNLDNVNVPPGNTIEGGCNRKIKVQNDLDDWELDGQGNPTEPLNKKQRLRDGVSIDPQDIPNEHIREEEISKAEWDRTYAKGLPSDSWFKEIPTIIKTETKKITSTIEDSVWQKMKAKGDYHDFDSEPKLVSSKEKMMAVLQTDDNGRLVLDNMRPIVTGKELVTMHTVIGSITTHTIRGVGKLIQ